MIFIAEIGMNHNGNINLCYELIKQAKYAGANIAKFQLGWRDKPGEINHITKKDLKNILSWGKYFNIQVMFSIITEDAFKLIKKFSPNSYKIASRTVIDNKNLVKKILKQKKTTYISLGMWNKKKLPFTKTKNIKYLWCKSTYPNTLKDLKGFPMNFRKSPYDGFSDHTIGIETSLLAIARGAEIIEKHFTLDKSNTSIRDHALSATPEEFKTLVNLGTEINKRILSGI